MGTLTIRLPEDLRRELKRLCDKENRPFSDIVRGSLRQYLAARKFQTLRGKTLPFAEAQGLLTDEDIFKAIS